MPIIIFSVHCTRLGLRKSEAVVLVPTLPILVWLVQLARASSRCETQPVCSLADQADMGVSVNKGHLNLFGVRIIRILLFRVLY